MREWYIKYKIIVFVWRVTMSKMFGYLTQCTCSKEKESSTHQSFEANSLDISWFFEFGVMLR